jgi:hypothetical protein
MAVDVLLFFAPLHFRLAPEIMNAHTSTEKSRALAKWKSKREKQKTKKMFHSALGVFQATQGIFCATDARVPDELRGRSRRRATRFSV